MMRQRVMRLGLAVALSLGTPMLAACDPEDMRDVEEGVNEVEEGVEKGAKEVEEEIDEADTDGKDD